MLAAFLLLNLAAILAAAALSLPPAARALALPWPLPGDAPAWGWAAAPATLLFATGALWQRARRRVAPARRRAHDAAVAALLVWPLLFAAVWSWSAADRPSRADFAALAVVLLAVAALVARARARGDPLGFARAALAPALRALAWPTAVAVVAAAAWGLAQGRRPGAGALALSLAGYPLWALLQTLVLLALPWPLLQRAGAGPRALVAGIPLLFALAHWPNAPLMLACLVAMLLWVRVWRRHPSLVAVALAMGVSATALLQLGPETGFEHARVGPRAVRQRLLAALAAPGAVPDTTDHAALVRACFPTAVGRAPTAAETDAWAAALGTRLRERVAWQFLTSDELRARSPRDALPKAGRFALPDGEAGRRVARLGAEAFRREAGGDDRAFLRALYRHVLGREASDAEVAGWAPALAPDRRQREALAGALFDARRALRAPPDDAGVLAARLRLP